MTNHKTYIINFISGPGSGKSTICALVFAKLKLKGFVCEYIQEYPKTLVWTKDFDTLNNQYFVSMKQFNILKQMVGTVQYVCTDGPLVHGLYYNLYNKDNTSNIQKTEKMILDNYNQFDNINIFLERGNFKYEPQGRLQTEDEARDIDVILKHMLKQNKIPYTAFISDPENVDKIIEHIISFN